jgi:hypothetical protein
VLDAFRHVPDSWLTGGGALAAFHTGHRRSYDLFVLEQLGWVAMDGLADAQRKDGGLDAPTLGWVLADLSIDLGGLLLQEPVDPAALSAFRDALVAALQREAWPNG